MRALRERAGLTKLQLCRRVELAPATVTRLEQGKLDCRWSTLVMFAQACGVKLDMGQLVVRGEDG